MTATEVRSLGWHPDAAVDALVFEGTQGVLAANPDLRRVLTVPERPGLIEHLLFLLKLARRYQAVVNNAPERTTIVSTVGSFHGRTFATVAITGQPKYRKDFEPLLAGARWTPPNDIAALEASVGPQTAGIVVEGIQGEGGIHPMHGEFLRRARALAEFHLRQGDAEAAGRAAEVHAKADPKSAMGPFLRGLALDRLGKGKEAIEAYESAIAKDPKFLDAHKNLAILCITDNPVYSNRERTKNAFDHFAKYFELGGRDEELRRTYETIKGFLEGQGGDAK